MLFGIEIRGWMLVAGGVALLVLLSFQMLVGLRKVKFKGPLHMKVHKGAAYAMLALALIHGLSGLTLVGII